MQIDDTVIIRVTHKLVIEPQLAIQAAIGCVLDEDDWFILVAGWGH